MKRSAQVGLVLMSAVGVGGSAYSMMPGRDCAPSSDSALHAPTAPGQSQNCAPRGSSNSGSSSHGGGSHWFYGGSSSSSSSSSGSAMAATSSPVSGGSTTHGGFGAIGRAFASFGG